MDTNWYGRLVKGVRQMNEIPKQYVWVCHQQRGGNKFPPWRSGAKITHERTECCHAFFGYSIIE